jgi:acyl-CoA thioesterase I
VPTHVACVGDSITYGYMASSTSTNYPSVMQGLFGSSVQVKNFGHSGATMLSTGDTPYQQQSEYTAATTFVSGAGAQAIVDVVLMLGTNDSKPGNWTSGSGTRAQQFQTDCGALVDHFAQLATHPLVFLALPPEAYSNSYGIDGSVLDNQIIPIIKQVAAAKNLPIIDLNTPTKGHPELFGDGVHPTDAGYALIAHTVHDALLAYTSGAGGAGGGAAGGGGAGAGGAAGAGHSGGAAGGGSGTGGGVVSTGGVPATGGTGGGPAGAPGSTGGAGTATGGAGGQPPSATTTGSSGCSCTTGGSPSGDARWALAMLLLMAIIARLRRGAPALPGARRGRRSGRAPG